MFICFFKLNSYLFAHQQVNFYSSNVDDIPRAPGPQRCHPLVLCKNIEGILAWYDLRDIHKPIGISGYELTRALPENLGSGLLGIEEVEAELGEMQGSGDE
ncbi:MAG TPA: PDDEXK nuclease domain-containing protein [Candidatus Methanoperedens sp.]